MTALSIDRNTKMLAGLRTRVLHTHLRWLVALVLACSAPYLSASELSDAKAQGLVGEQANGYIAAVDGGPGAAELVATINAKRRLEYGRIAAKNGIELAAVEKLAGKRTIERSASGAYIKVADKWQRKP